MKSTVLIVIAVFMINYSFSQGLVPQVVPPSPETASLGKHLNSPVNYFSGLPQVDIPLYQIANQDIAIPVLLSYHAGGIRVEEITSRIGLGWNLQVGGAVTRYMRGLPDDLAQGFLNTPHTVDEFRSASATLKFSLMSSALNGEIDYEPDVFNVSYPGYSGKFVINRSGEVMTIPNSDHKVVYSTGDGGISRFTITDENGYVYIFGSYNGSAARDYTRCTATHIDTSDGVPVPNNPIRFYSSWHLMAILSPKSNSVVSYSYKTRNISTLQRSGQRKAFSFVNCSGSGGIATTYIINETEEAVLDQIDYELGTIEFDYEPSERLDLPGDKALERITITNITGDVLKTLDFEHDYFQSPDAPTTRSPVATFNKEHLTHRLYLKGIKEWNNIGSKSKNFNFEYNDRVFMPNRFSFAQDMWGFFNGHNENTQLIPTHYKEPSSDGTIETIPGADRTVNSSKTLSLALRKITYPSGGSTEYIYENHEVKRTNADADDPVFEIKRDNLINYSYNEGDVKRIELEFEVKDYHINNRLHYTSTVIGCPEDDPVGGISYCGLEISIIGVGFSYVKSLSLQNDLYFEVPRDGKYKVNISVVGGTEVGDDIIDLSFASARIDAFKKVSSSAGGGESSYIVGGLRIRNVIKEDGLGNKLIKEYTYLQEGQTEDETSGLLSTQLMNFYEEGVGCGEVSSSSTVQTSYSPIASLGTGSGHVGYTEVREVKIPDNDLPFQNAPEENAVRYPNGYTSFRYDWAYDKPSLNSESFPYAPYEILDWKKGNLRSSTVYKMEDGNLLPQSKTVNSYEYSHGLGDPLFKSINAIKIDQRGSHKSYAYYNIVTGANHVINTTVTRYEGDQEVASTMNYFYESTFLRPSRVTYQNSAGRTIVEETKYPYDANEIDELTPSERSVLSDMVALRNIKSVPILKKSYLESTNEVISQKLTIFNENENKFQPKIIKIWNPDKDKFEQESVFHYSAQNNLVQVDRRGGQSTCHIWSYGNKLPIAKVRNASYNEVSTVLGNALSELENGIPSVTDIMSNISLLRDVQSMSEITVYNYKIGVGLISVTDLNGQNLHYTYDHFNRLESVLDNENKWLKTYEYYLKNVD